MKRMIFAATLSAALSSPVIAQDLHITITNLTHGSHFTPVLVAAHMSGDHLFQVGEAASDNLQTMAEGGDISGLVSDLNALNADVVDNPAGGLLAPGASTSFDLMTQDQNDQLSVTAMLLPTNDAFMGLDSISIPDQPGHYVYLLNAYDAGTEANDELITGGGAPGVPGIPVDPLGADGMNGTGLAGADSNTNVHIHRGVIGDTDPNGGPSDLDGNIHRWLNPVARVEIDVN